MFFFLSFIKISFEIFVLLIELGYLMESFVKINFCILVIVFYFLFRSIL